MPERRQHPRFAIQGTGKIQIFLPEQTLRPDPYDFKELNLSVSGVLGLIENMPNNIFLAILREKRFCEIELPMPSGAVFKSYARIAWFDFNNKVKPSVLRIGVEFSETTEEQARILEEGLRELIRINPMPA